MQDLHNDYKLLKKVTTSKKHKSKDFDWEIIPFDSAMSQLDDYPQGSIVFDYETSGLQVWSPEVLIVGFGITLLDDPYKKPIYIHLNRHATKEEKIKFLNFLKKRSVWVFNLPFEGSLTWRYFGEQKVENFYEFEDVFAQTKADGYNQGLKPLAQRLLKVNNWADIWETVIFCEKAAKFVYSRPLHPISNYMMNIKESENELSEFKKLREDSSFVYEKNFLSLCDKHRNNFSITEVSEILNQICVLEKEVKIGTGKKATFEIINVPNPYLVNIGLIDPVKVGEYCCLDVIYTARCQKVLTQRVGKKQYEPYRDQSLIAMTMSAYSVNWDYKYSETLEKLYLSKIVEFFRLLYKIPQFCVIDVTDKIEIAAENFTTLEEYKTWWNPISYKQIETFYSSVESKRLKNSMFAYHVYKYCQKYGFYNEIEINGEIKKEYLIDKLKFDTIEKIVPEIYKRVIDSQDEFEVRKFKKCISSGKIAFHENKFTMGITKGVKTKKLTLESEHLNELYLSMKQCMYLDVESRTPFKNLPWEYQILYCTKLIKKYSKSLTSYINGKVGRARISNYEHSGNLMDPPIRKSDRGVKPINGYRSLLELEYNECGADTKRWRASIHTLPSNGELRELLIPRVNNSIFCHYDYSQSEIRVMAKMAGEEEMLEQFRMGVDIHRWVASKIWNKPMKDVLPGERRFSKRASFSILYGKTPEAFAKDFMNGDLNAVNKLFNTFFSTFPNLKIFIDKQHKDVMKNRYVTTLYGDKIYIDFDPYNRRKVSEAKRFSVNYPIQSWSSSMAAVGIWNVYKNCRRLNVEAIPLIFTHDSSDWEILLKWLRIFIVLVQKIAVDNVEKEWEVPVKVDFEIGICPNHMMSVENMSVGTNYTEFEFSCYDNFFERIIEKLRQYWIVEYEINERKNIYESANELFMTQRSFSTYIEKDMLEFSGKLRLIEPNK